MVKSRDVERYLLDMVHRDRGPRTRNVNLAAIRFALRWPGAQTYMFHCHNLEHEDAGMMLGVKVA